MKDFKGFEEFRKFSRGSKVFADGLCVVRISPKDLGSFRIEQKGFEKFRKQANGDQRGDSRQKGDSRVQTAGRR